MTHKNIDNVSNDVRAFIYQNTNALEQHLLPGSNLSVVFLDSVKKDEYKVKFILKTPQFAVDSVGIANNPFDAVKEAKEKMFDFLGDVNSQVANLLGEEPGEEAGPPKLIH